MDFTKWKFAQRNWIGAVALTACASLTLWLTGLLAVSGSGFWVVLGVWCVTIAWAIAKRSFWMLRRGWCVGFGMFLALYAMQLQAGRWTDLQRVQGYWAFMAGIFGTAFFVSRPIVAWFGVRRWADLSDVSWSLLASMFLNRRDLVSEPEWKAVAQYASERFPVEWASLRARWTWLKEATLEPKMAAGTEAHSRLPKLVLDLGGLVAMFFATQMSIGLIAGTRERGAVAVPEPRKTETIADRIEHDWRLIETTPVEEWLPEGGRIFASAMLRSDEPGILCGAVVCGMLTEAVTAVRDLARAIENAFQENTMAGASGVGAVLGDRWLKLSDRQQLLFNFASRWTGKFDEQRAFEDQEHRSLETWGVSPFALWFSPQAGMPVAQQKVIQKKFCARAERGVLAAARGDADAAVWVREMPRSAWYQLWVREGGGCPAFGRR